MFDKKIKQEIKQHELIIKELSEAINDLRDAFEKEYQRTHPPVMGGRKE